MIFENAPEQNRSDARLIKLLGEIIKNLDADATQRKASLKQRQRRRESLRESYAGEPTVADKLFERIIQGNDLTDINYLMLGVVRARAVGRVVIRQNGRIAGYGTGFLVAPGVLMTNQHVLETAALVRESTVQFRYERDVAGQELSPVEFALRVDPAPLIHGPLDVAFAAVEPIALTGESLDSFGWLRLNPSPGKAFVGEYLTIIQHPGGERKQICVRENRLLKYDDNSPFIWYQTDTTSGSSGSPAFNNSWDVVAIHHRGVPKTDASGRLLAKNGKVWTKDMGDDAIDWFANEGVRISSILKYLNDAHPNHPISRAVRQATDARLEVQQRSLSGERDIRSGGVQVSTDQNGNTRVFLPLELGIKLGISGTPAPLTNICGDGFVVPRGGSSEPQTVSANVRGDAIASTSLIEKVEINQDNYEKRNGYDPKFLGPDLIVPLPKLGAGLKAVKVKGQQTELKYWNYSVVMNASRRLAFFSAANVNTSQFKGARDKAGDTWYRDTRIDDELQVGAEFYKKQRDFEADRTQNPFDQGHLTSRGNLQWGATDAIAKRNGDESFHYTNCAPQHWQFNQNNARNGLWFRLETSAIDTLSEGNRLCIINGPIFDAPLSIRGQDGRLHLNLKGKSSPDMTFGGVAIPKLFFKLFAYNRDGVLGAKAFIVTQEDLLQTVDRMQDVEAATLTDAEIALYQVKISDLEKLTKLKFGISASKDMLRAEESLGLDDGARRIDSEDDFLLD